MLFVGSGGVSAVCRYMWCLYGQYVYVVFVWSVGISGACMVCRYMWRLYDLEVYVVFVGF